MELRFNKVNKYFNDFHVLKDIDFRVSSGQIFGFLGRNGAGKTTALRILMEVFKQDSGSITMDGRPFSPSDYRIGYLPEERGMYGKSLVKDQLVYFDRLRGASKTDAIASVEYWAQKFGIDIYLNKKLETLSKGNQQRVQITQAFLNEPDILILDEPFSGLDPVNASIFQEALRDYISDERIIIFSSHQMSYVEEFCDDIAIIDLGQIVLEGSLQDIKSQRGGNKKRVRTLDFDLEAYLTERSILFERDDESLIVDIESDIQAMELLNKLIEEGVKLDLYSAYRPSLQEIFVSLVGGEKR